MESSHGVRKTEILTDSKQLLFELKNLHVKKITICNDPLNGCPEDFAEDFNRRIDSLLTKVYGLGISDEDISNAISEGIEEGNREVDEMFGGSIR